MRAGTGEQFIQPDGRSFSQWLTLGETSYIRCCDCGLYHEWQFKARDIKRGPNKGQIELTGRCKVNRKKTKEWRAENGYRHPRVDS